MKWYILESDKYHEVEIFNKNHQVAFSSWKAGNRIGIGKWGLFLINDEKYEVLLGEFYYYGYELDWNKIQTLQWINIGEDAGYISIVGLQIRFMDNKLEPINYPKDWQFKIYIKTKEESGEGSREDEEFIPDLEFCTDSITTVGPSKTLDAICPIDPSTKKTMNQCLNWRRVDQVGRKCRAIMDEAAKEKSMDVFCGKDYDLADCRCINRRFHAEYQKAKLTQTKPDYCWYLPCASGSYLSKRKGRMVQCIIGGGYPNGISFPMANPDY